MEKTNLKNHQHKALEALEQVQEICKKHNIKFFLLAGSVLGAVRHKGFIPWDDDIDIGMLPDDLYKFNQVIERSLSDGFVWSTPENNRRHPRFFGKILYNGKHCIDVFPIVKTSDNPLKRKTQWIIRKIVLQIYMRKINYTPVLKFKGIYRKIVFIFSWILSLFIKREWAISIARWNEHRFESEDTDFYLNIYSCYSMKKELIKREWVENLAPIEFEGKEYLAFKDTDAYLTHLYGDYMKLPPEDMRVPPHPEIFIVEKL